MKVSDFTVLIDMDSTVYDLMTPWLEWYNDGLWDGGSHDVSPLMTYPDVTRWDWHLDTDVRCQEKLYGFFTEGMNLKLEPFPGAIDAIRRVHQWGVRQLFVSTCTTKTGPWEKQQVIQRDFPFIGKEKLLITGGYKGMVNGHLLLDDAPHNLNAFKKDQLGYTCLARLQELGYNRDYKADGLMTQWQDYEEIVDWFIGKWFTSKWGASSPELLLTQK